MEAGCCLPGLVQSTLCDVTMDLGHARSGSPFGGMSVASAETLHLLSAARERSSVKRRLWCSGYWQSL